MEDSLTKLYLDNEEEEVFEKDAKVIKREKEFSLVGTCLTKSFVHFPSLRNTMADL